MNFCEWMRVLALLSVEQSNFGDYGVMRMFDFERPTGIGEIDTPCLAPAITSSPASGSITCHSRRSAYLPR